MVSGRLTFEIEKLAVAWQLDVNRCAEIFRDGRMCHQPITEHLVKAVGGKLPLKSDSRGFDFYDAQGGKWESRTMTTRGVEFAPSVMRGAGRKFNMVEFLAGLTGLSGFAVADIVAFPPTVEYVFFPATYVQTWWHNGWLTATGGMAYSDARAEIFGRVRSGQGPSNQQDLFCS